MSHIVCLSLLLELNAAEGIIDLQDFLLFRYFRQPKKIWLEILWF